MTAKEIQTQMIKVHLKPLLKERAKSQVILDWMYMCVKVSSFQLTGRNILTGTR